MYSCFYDCFLTLKSQLVEKSPSLKSRNVDTLMQKIQAFLLQISKENFVLKVPALIELKSILMDANTAKLQDNNDLKQLHKLSSKAIIETLGEYKTNDCNISFR